MQEKIDWVFEVIKTVDPIPGKFFEHLTNTEGIFEIRVAFQGNIYRILCFFDEGDIIILINSFQKKTQKTPKYEIALAEKLKKQYFADKKLEHEDRGNTKNRK